MYPISLFSLMRTENVDGKTIYSFKDSTQILPEDMGGKEDVFPNKNNQVNVDVSIPSLYNSVSTETYISEIQEGALKDGCKGLQIKNCYDIHK